MTPMFGGGGVGYEEALRAIGREAERKGLRNLCVMELEGGVVLQGQILKNTQEGYILSIETSVFKREEVETLVKRAKA